MTQYLMAVYIDENAAPPAEEEIQQLYKQVDVFNQKLMEAGQWVFGGGLHPTSTATVVKAHEGEVVTTDGPYAEAKEVLGGFWVIEAPDLDAALALAKEASAACQGPVELRPFQDE